MTTKRKATSKTRITSKLVILLLFFAAPFIHAGVPRFFSPSFFPTTTFAAALVADLNEDGIPDVAACWGGDPGTAYRASRKSRMGLLAHHKTML